jgi:hypothetical protein
VRVRLFLLEIAYGLGTPLVVGKVIGFVSEEDKRWIY